MENICIGIDLGTTFSAVGFWNEDHCEIIQNKDGRNITPSWVSFTDNEILIGDSAKIKASINPENTLFDIKRIIGKRFNDEQLQSDIHLYPFKIFGDSSNTPNIQVKYKGENIILKPEQVSAFILTYLKEIAEERIGKKVNQAVITVPAYFNNSQRESTKQAAKIANLDCIRIINEPTAACLCYGIDKLYTEANILVFDLGGGTFDVSILKVYNGIFEVLATSGNPHLGGEDFDNKLMDFLIEDFENKSKTEFKRNNKNLRKLKNIAEKAKCSLSTSFDYLIEFDINNYEYIYELKRKKFEQICDNLFNLTLEPVKMALLDSKLNKNDINEIVLVGGSTRIPRVRELLSNFFNGKKLNMSVHPDEAVAIGATIQSAILNKNDSSEKTKDILLLDVIPLSLGVEAKGGMMSKIIEKNTQIPIKMKKMYSTSEDKQTTVEIKVFEGEREFVKDNHKIGTFELIDIPKQPRGVPKIEICFDVDRNGILSIYATEINSGVNNKIIINDSTKLTQEEINKMIEDAERYKADDEIKKFAMSAKNSYDKYLAEIQRIINDTELTMDDEGKCIFTENELIMLNKSIISNIAWLDDDDEFRLTKEMIESARATFEHSIKAYLNHIYLRKQQIELRNTFIKEEPEIDVNKIADMIDNEE